METIPVFGEVPLLPHRAPVQGYTATVLCHNLGATDLGDITCLAPQPADQAAQLQYHKPAA